MKPDFALDLSHDGINLLHRAKGGWTLVGTVALDDPDMGARLDDLRKTAAMLESGGFTCKVIIPNSQILYTTLAAPGPDDISREVQIRAALDGLTPYPVGELVFDWRAEGDQARVAVVARETMDEAETFAAQYKFNPVSFVARPERGEFSGEPFFGKTRAATRLLPPGERVEPDASPVPRNPRAMELKPEARIDAPPVAAEAPPAAEPVPAPVPEPADAPLPDAVEPAPAPVASDDAFAELDALAADLGRPDLPGENEAPAAPPPPRKPRPRRDEAPRVSAPVLAPFPPTEDEKSATPMPAPRPFMPAPARGRAAPPPSPQRPAPAAPRPDAPAPRGAPELPAAPHPADAAEAPAAAPAAPAAFQSRRAAPDAAPPSGTAERLKAMAPRIGIGGGGDDAPAASPAASPAAPPPRAPAPAVLSDIDDDLPPRRGAFAPVDRIRADMADALARPLPTPDKPFVKTAKGPGPLAGLAGALRGAVGKAGDGVKAAGAAARSKAGARAEARAARKAEAEAAAPSEAARSDAAPPPSAQPAAPPADAAAKPARKAPFAFGRKPRRSEADEKRAREAEALTVFGARKAEASRGKPRYLGLTLTLLLLLAMAVIAVWSSFLVDDGEVTLFNPGPEITVAGTDSPAPPADEPVVPPSDLQPATPAPDPAATPAVAPPATAEVLSPEAAEARYAATGIWQRAPEPLPEPDSTRLEPLDVTGLAPLAIDRAANPLPEPGTGALASAALADPVPPPPPGTSFDLDANGLVRPTPEGALSPTGILVFQGRPPAVPPARPGAPAAAVAVPPAEPPAAAATPAPADAGAGPAAAPLALPGVPRVRPPQRPAGLVPAPAAPAAPALPAAPEAPAPDAAADPDNAALDTGAGTTAVAGLRPAPRPGDLVVSTATATAGAAIDAAVDDVVETAFAGSSELAVARSIKPSHRPANFARIVDAAQAEASDGSAVVAASAPAAATTTPAIPSSASVAREATVKNALNLREINLIGIYGTSNARRALVRLDNGRYVKVQVGDRLDGGKVTSISSTSLTYQKGSRAYTLEVLPLG